MTPDFKENHEKSTNSLYTPYYYMLQKSTKKNFMAPFHGWGSTASREEPLGEGSLLFQLNLICKHQLDTYQPSYLCLWQSGIIICLVVVCCSTSLFLDSFNNYDFYVAIAIGPATKHSGGLHCLTDQLRRQAKRVSGVASFNKKTDQNFVIIVMGCK